MFTRQLPLLLFNLPASVALAALDGPDDESWRFAEDEVELRRIKGHDGPVAYQKKDTLLLGRILADEFVVIDADGQTSAKRGELEYLKRSGHVTYESFGYTIERLRVYGQAALVAGTGRSRGRMTKGPFHNLPLHQLVCPAGGPLASRGFTPIGG